MAPPKMVYAILLAGSATMGCSVIDVELTPLSPAGAPVIADQNPVYVPLGKEQYGKVYENVLQTLHDFGFTVAETNRYDGRIEVTPRVAPGIGFSPTPSIVDSLRALLVRHNDLEEGPNGLYAVCDALVGEESEAVVARLRAQPRVPLAKYYDGPLHRRPS